MQYDRAAAMKHLLKFFGYGSLTKKIQFLVFLRCLNLSEKIRVQEQAPNTSSGAILPAELLRRTVSRQGAELFMATHGVPLILPNGFQAIRLSGS